MANDPDEIHFDCPKCKRPMSGDKTLLGEMLNCPDCGEAFWPVPRNPSPKAKPEDRTPRQCPACGKVVMIMDSNWLEETVTCPNCNGAFSPKMWISHNPHAALAEINSQIEELNRKRRTEPQRTEETQTARRAEEIRVQANRFTAAAVFFSVFAAAAVLCAIASGDRASSGWCLAGALIGVALWLYLIAQIIHIRANTEK